MSQPLNLRLVLSTMDPFFHLAGWEATLVPNHTLPPVRTRTHITEDRPSRLAVLNSSPCLAQQ